MGTILDKGHRMAKLKFRTISKRTVDALTVEDRDAVFWDDRIPGFGVRVYPSGSKVYVVQTRHRGKSHRVTLGRHGVITADRARKEAALAINRIKSGEDPVERGSVTVAELAARYLEEHVDVRCKESTRKMYRSVVERFIVSSYGRLAVEDVERKHINQLHLDLRHIPYQANRALAFLHDGRVEMDSNFVGNRLRPIKLTAKKRAVRQTRRGCAHMGPDRQPHRDLQNERRRACRLAQ